MILLDTCAFIWDALAPAELSNEASAAIDHASGDLLVCDITFWEIAMLIKKQRLRIDDSARGFIRLALQARGYAIREISPEIAELSANLPTEIGNDPADRLIAATSILGQAPIVTADRRLRESPLVETIW